MGLAEFAPRAPRPVEHMKGIFQSMVLSAVPGAGWRGIFSHQLTVMKTELIPPQCVSACRSLVPPALRALALSACLAGLVGCATQPGPARVSKPALRDALLLHASFDGRADADFAAGDATLYTAPTGNRQQARPGLPDGDLVVLARGEGRHGDALRFTKKMKPVVFFRGEKNLGHTTNGWSGAVSLWLKLDPDRDLEPGYCDPLQFVAQGWDEGNMFIEFSKDHTPRHFRYAILPVKKLWNAQNRGWEEIPETERPMVPVHRPPFSRERWTHVVFCFGNLNTGAKDGWGKLYLNGERQGEFTGWLGTFNWDVTQSAVTLGLNYVGLLDDLAIFNRPLTDGEVKAIHQSPAGMLEVVK
ncbi:MAG: LamG domain-containing protein [Pedosphaera sp.]|nr:LamG domain-containing protein [Pedosphaera sp.]